MKPYISIITLGVSDLVQSTHFYTALGFPLESSSDQISFFQLVGIKLALYPKELLAQDAKVTSMGSGCSGITLAHNVSSKSDVDTIMTEARALGAVVTDPPHDREWGGYSGYFSDPDGYLWEIAWNPHDTNQNNSHNE